MLRELFIENFALIDCLRLEFGRGFNILTGETGAGNRLSLIPSACCLGGVLRWNKYEPAPRQRRSKGFEIDNSPELITLLVEWGFRGVMIICWSFTARSTEADEVVAG